MITRPLFLSCVLLTSVATLTPVGALAKPIRFRLPSDPITLDWNLAHTSNETQILMNMMVGLLESGEDLKVKPALAEKWDISADGLTYIFTLRKDAKWSDGQPVTAQQFVDSWLRLLDPKSKSPYASFLFDIQGAEEFAQGKKSKVAISAPNPQTFKVTLHRRSPTFIYVPTFWVTFPLRRENLEVFTKSPTEVAKLKVTGPYKPTRWITGKTFILEPNPLYPLPRKHGLKPDDRIEITFEKSEEKARLAYKKGDVDFLLQASTQDLMQLQGAAGNASKDGARLIQAPYLSTTYLGIHTQLAPVRQSALRQAIALVVLNEKSKFPALLQGGQAVAESWAPPSILGHRSLPAHANALFEARQLLNQMGYANGQGLPKLKICTEIFDRSSALVDALAKALDQHLGIKTEIVNHATGSQFVAALNTNSCHLFVTHWGGDYPDPANFYDVFKTGAPANYPRWSNATYDDLLKKGLTTSDDKSRMEIYAQLDELLIEKEAVIVPLFYPKNAWIVSNSIKKMVLTPLNYLYLKDTEIENAAAATP